MDTPPICHLGEKNSSYNHQNCEEYILCYYPQTYQKVKGNLSVHNQTLCENSLT
jgi:hypothetical protein